MLLAGFGGLLTLMLAGGIDSLIRIHKVDRQETGVREVYLQRALSLEQMRAGIYQSSILPDYLLADPNRRKKSLRSGMRFRRPGHCAKASRGSRGGPAI